MRQQMPSLILFDLGGVLIRVAGVERMLTWAPYLDSPEEMWNRWLTSPIVRTFEAGGSTPETFARQMIEAFRLPVDADLFLAEFRRWPAGLYPGAEALLAQLGNQFTLGALSNTNQIHWDLFETEMTFLEHFQYRFASHQTGMLKPDLETYRWVAGETGLPPERILFMDDNRANVEGAREAGMIAYRVDGVVGVKACLGGVGIL